MPMAPTEVSAIRILFESVPIDGLLDDVRSSVATPSVCSRRDADHCNDRHEYCGY